jgi:hypothetical protein
MTGQRVAASMNQTRALRIVSYNMACAAELPARAQVPDSHRET